MKEVSLSRFIRIMQGWQAATVAAGTASLTAAAELVEETAKDILGEYQTEDTGEIAPWQMLAESTLAHLGLQDAAPEDHSPLLRKGDLRDSIGHKVEYPVAVVGSDDEVALYQELGTATIPPRSFLALAAFRKAQEVAEMHAEAFAFALRGLKWRANRR